MGASGLLWDSGSCIGETLGVAVCEFLQTGAALDGPGVGESPAPCP